MFKRINVFLVLLSVKSFAATYVPVRDAPSAPILVVSAVQDEAQDTLNALQSAGVAHEYLCIGISINATKAEVALRAAAPGKHVLYIGTAGTLSDSFSEPYLATASTVVWMPTGQRVGDGTALPSLFANFTISSPYIAAALPKKWLLTSPTVSHTSAIDTTVPLAAADDLIENMEGYYVANALNGVAVASFDIVMGVTNQTSADGHDQWVKNAPIVAEMTATLVMNFLQVPRTATIPSYERTRYGTYAPLVAAPVASNPYGIVFQDEMERPLTCWGKVCEFFDDL